MGLWQQVALLMPLIFVNWVCYCLFGILDEGLGLDGTHRGCDSSLMSRSDPRESLCWATR